VLTRIISGVVMGAGAFWVLVYAPWWAFAALVGLMGWVGCDEHLRMARPGVGVGGRAALGALTALLALTPVLARVTGAPSGALGGGLWALAFVGVALAHLARPLPLEGSAGRVALDLLGVSYLGLTLPSLLELRALSLGAGGEASAWGWVLLAMLVTFGGDTGGYFAGRALGGKLTGGRRLAPSLSPKKTWEGFAGGLLLGVGGAFAARAWCEACGGLSALDCLVLGGVGVPLGVAGDLFESMLKRSAGVKDSGTLIPGHGGVLDRIDALLFVAPFVLFYVRDLRPLLAGAGG